MTDATLASLLKCDPIALAQMPECIEQLRIKLEVSLSLGMEATDLRKKLLLRLPAARLNSLRLIEQLRSIAAQCDRMVRDMDFAFLLDRRRKLLSIGYDAEARKVHAACYDLLASEARIAAFISIAKGDIPQESWFQMSRSHVVVEGRPVLISWTGTMFEYLMPQLWMRSYPDDHAGEQQGSPRCWRSRSMPTIKAFRGESRNVPLPKSKTTELTGIVPSAFRNWHCSRTKTGWWSLRTRLCWLSDRSP